MQVTTQSTIRAGLQADFDFKEQVYEEVSARGAKKGRLALLPGSTSPWPDMRDCDEYLAARRAYAEISQALSKYCRDQEGMLR